MKRLIRLIFLYLALVAVFAINAGPVDGAMSTAKVVFEYQQF
ncbi:MAG TPA: hypothetical protein VGO35_03950 [Gammaproteobacteria bacterium]|jgi:hypothetical protein|nr:hypothetical protein [Gammaproteobacteria bacterium]